MFYPTDTFQPVIDSFDESPLSKQDFILKQHQGIFRIVLKGSALGKEFSANALAT